MGRMEAEILHQAVLLKVGMQGIKQQFMHSVDWICQIYDPVGSMTRRGYRQLYLEWALVRGQVAPKATTERCKKVAL